MAGAALYHDSLINILRVLLLSWAENSDSGSTDRDFAVGDPTFELRCDSV